MTVVRPRVEALAPMGRKISKRCGGSFSAPKNDPTFEPSGPGELFGNLPPFSLF